MNSQSAVCYLVINKLPDAMVQMSIESALRNSSEDFYVGYLRLEDVSNLPQNPRIKLIELSAADLASKTITSSKYVDFNDFRFFELVALKWKLFENVFELGYSHIVYADTDVLWFRDLVSEFRNTHQKFPNYEILIQSQGLTPSDPFLCMGIVSFLNTARVQQAIKNCFEWQTMKLNENVRRSDDDAISHLYNSTNASEWIMQLPQVYYPTGQLINLYGRRSAFLRVKGPTPHIFHANFIIGTRLKILLMKFALKLIDYENYKNHRLTLFEQIYHFALTQRIKQDNLARKFRFIRPKNQK